MRVLVTSDWHPDWVTFGVPRFDEVERAVDKTVETAIKEKCQFYFFLGDLCDPDSGPVVFRCVDLAIRTALRLARHDIRSMWLVGNHDVIEDGSGTSTLLPLREIHPLVELHDEPKNFEEEGVADFLVLPFTPTSHTYDPREHVNFFTKLRGKGIVLSHLSCPGIVPGEETETMPRGRDVMLPLVEINKRPDTIVFQGHYHERQSHGILHIPGSLARLTFSHVDYNPSFLVVDL